MVSSLKWVVPLLIVSALAGSHPLSAQEFKLPNFLPFKKRNREVQPFKLTDQSSPKTPETGGRSLFNFRSNRQPDLESAGPLADFNRRTKKFFSDAGQGLSNVADETRKILVEGWNPPSARQAWWNEGPDSSAKPSLFLWLKSPQRPSFPPLLRPESTRPYSSDPPRHRF